MRGAHLVVAGRADDFGGHVLHRANQRVGALSVTHAGFCQPKVRDADVALGVQQHILLQSDSSVFFILSKDVSDLTVAHARFCQPKARDAPKALAARQHILLSSGSTNSKSNCDQSCCHACPSCGCGPHYPATRSPALAEPPSTTELCQRGTPTSAELEGIKLSASDFALESMALRTLTGLTTRCTMSSECRCRLAATNAAGLQDTDSETTFLEDGYVHAPASGRGARCPVSAGGRWPPRFPRNTAVPAPHRRCRPWGERAAKVEYCHCADSDVKSTRDRTSSLLHTAAPRL